MVARPPLWLALGLALFLASAALAASVAPQPDLAWVRFGGLALAAGLGLGLALIPGRWAGDAVAAFPVVVVALIAAGRFGLLGAMWSANTIGGAAALALPFAALTAFRPGRPMWRWAAGAALVALLALLVLSRSRGAVLGLLVAGALGALWWASRTWGSRRAWWVGALVVGGFAAAWVALVSAWPAVVPFIDGVDVGGTDMGRISIWRDTIYLIAQAPFTGWGPATFEGAFALYARIIRVPLFTYAHQLYLGIAFEQGLGGLAVWIALQLAALVALCEADIREGGADLTRLAALTSVVTLAVHGLLDDPVFAGGAVPLLFVGAGFAALASRSTALAQRRFTPQRLAWVGLSIAVIAGVLAGFSWSRLLAAWDANRGVLALNAQELAHWPTIDEVTQPAPALSELAAALSLEPDQSAALFRRGLLELTGRDFAAAEVDLSQAYAGAPDSRAVRKSLGYARLWLGDVDGAALLLGPLPEAAVELQAYLTYWQSQGEPDLSGWAGQLLERLTP